jgi:hypothetical protein
MSCVRHGISSSQRKSDGYLNWPLRKWKSYLPPTMEN